MPKIDYRKTTSENFENKPNLSDTEKPVPRVSWAIVFSNCVASLKRSAPVLYSIKSNSRKCPRSVVAPAAHSERELGDTEISFFSSHRHIVFYWVRTGYYI